MSEKYKLQIIDDSSFNLSLEKVSYNSLGIPEGLSKGENLKLRTKDNYKILRIRNNEVKIEFIREKYFEPIGLFQLKIVLNIVYKLRESNNKEKMKGIEQDLKNGYSRLLSPAATRASILVTALTGINFKNPIVDPPYPVL
jgi:hypothetical protein